MSIVYVIMQEIKNDWFIDSTIKILLSEELRSVFHMLLLAVICSVLSCFPLMGEV